MTRLRKLVYGLVIAALVLGASEWLLRILSRQIGVVGIPSSEIVEHIRAGELAYHPELGWDWADPPIELLEIDEHGFRYGPISTEKPPGTWRGFTVGDSQTHGAGVTRSQSYTGLTEARLRLLAEPGWRIELVNAACYGYSSLQALRLIRLRLLDFDPDLIVVDCMTQDSYRDERVSPMQGMAWINGLLFECRLYQVMSLLLQHVGLARRPGFRSPANLVRDAGKRYGNHDLIAQLAREEGFTLVLGNYPRWESNRDQISCLAPDNHLPPGVAIARFYETLVDSGLAPSELFFDNNHLSPAGNMCAADALVDAILPILLEDTRLAPSSVPSDPPTGRSMP